MVTFLANENGAVTQRMIDYYSERARGGVGLIIVESAYVKEQDRDMGRIGIENPQLQVGLNELAESIREQGARAFLQLNHRGSVLSIKKGKGPDELSREEIENLIEAFASAAAAAKKAGFDGVEIHGANVYLISQFLSPLTNHRRDSFGQTQEGRMEFPLSILRRVRQTVGKDYPVIFRMVAHQYTEGGLNLDDTRVIARKMEEAGASCLHVIAGGTPSTRFLHCPPMAVPRGCHVSLAQEIKKAVRLPVIAVGRIHDPLFANQILTEGKADLVAMGRSLIADPDLPRKAQEGKLGEMRKCLACNHCRMRIELNQTIRCAVNARAGRERDTRISPTSAPKKVMVVGGGPAGMEAARVLGLQGHRVTLYEKEDRLGGQMKVGVLPPHKEELRNLFDFLVGQMSRIGIDLRMSHAVTEKTIEEGNWEAIILAVGANPLIPEIPGLEPGRVLTAAEALGGVRPRGGKYPHCRGRHGGL